MPPLEVVHSECQTLGPRHQLASVDCSQLFAAIRRMKWEGLCSRSSGLAGIGSIVRKVRAHESGVRRCRAIWNRLADGSLQRSMSGLLQVVADLRAEQKRGADFIAVCPR